MEFTTFERLRQRFSPQRRSSIESLFYLEQKYGSRIAFVANNPEQLEVVENLADRITRPIVVLLLDKRLIPRKKVKPLFIKDLKKEGIETIVFAFKEGREAIEAELRAYVLSTGHEISLFDAEASSKSSTLAPQIVRFRDIGILNKKGIHYPSLQANWSYCNRIRKYFADLAQKRVLDAFAGSGPIGLSLAKECRLESLALAEINPEAIPLVKEVVEREKLTNLKIDIFESDLFQSIPKGRTFDLVVANPPHVNKKSEKKHLALIGLDPGWEIHKAFFRDAKPYLSDQADLFLVENKPSGITESFYAALPEQHKEYTVHEVRDLPDHLFTTVWVKFSRQGSQIH